MVAFRISWNIHVWGIWRIILFKEIKLRDTNDLARLCMLLPSAQNYAVVFLTGLLSPLLIY